ncbi:SpoIIE family protein phosphatase [Calothrix rhizosoleniae]|uniref:SpoIIE family protein phosphatase n=1 Tax=Calothrix rhizosoleniae TaxID=888997 RepID=UPI000B49E25D|nr:SpoIIE family protein phosphatase [Calothrix rhizosoleniae]
MADKTRKLKLMVVDDELDNLELLYRTFRRNFQVYKAHNAQVALDILGKEGEMAVIISDQKMPEINGTEFIGMTVERFPNTMRILLTGFTDVEDLVDAINSGQVYKYLTKPWKPERLRAVVEQAIETYLLVKKRTDELSRALRRESLFNEITSAIRESLDYYSMLHKIVATIGQTFAASSCLLRPVEDDRLTEDEFSYYDSQSPVVHEDFDSSAVIKQVLATKNYQLIQSTHDQKSCHQLVIPFTYQQNFLAVLSLYQWGSDDRPWDDEDIQLICSVAEQAALAVSQAKLYQKLQEKQEQTRIELEVARQIQHNLLRQEFPRIPGTKVQACCQPAREVGGDFFEVFSHPKGDIWVAVGDVSGKGVPAALFMASAISILRRELSAETPPEPNIIIQNLNHALSDDLISNNYFITMALARYTPETGELAYANAGHIYPLIWSRQAQMDCTPNYLKVRGIPLGILPHWQAKSGRLVLESGDILLLTSDGITEVKLTTSVLQPAIIGDSQAISSSSMLNQDGLWHIIQQQSQPFSLQNLLTRIQEYSQIQEDDQTILSLEVL